MNRAIWRLPLLLAILLSPARLSFAQSDEPILVRQVEIKRVGPIPVSDAVVKVNIRTEVGKPLSRPVLDDDVRALYKTGYFLNIRVTQEPIENGVKVIFTIQGKATVKDVQIKGYKKVPLARLQRQIKVKVGDVLDERKVEDDKKKLTEYYQGLGYEKVVVRSEVKVDEDTGKASVTYAIEEGSRVFIQKIEFVGNKAFPAKRLQRQIKTKHRWFFSFMTKSGVLKPDQLDDDLDKLRAFYRDEGYIDVEIPKVEYLTPRPDRIIIRIRIIEGIQYKVGTVKVEGNKIFPTSDLMPALKMTEGKTFTPPGLTKDIDALRDYYGARGYIDAFVRPVRSANIQSGRMDLTYDITENQLSYIEKINISGNTKTKDKVIRRELAVAPGDVFDMVKVKRSRDRLGNLGYFSKVETNPESTDVASRKNLNVVVEEQKTGDLSFGAGFSSIDALVFFAEIKQGNFDLFNPPTFTGGGQKLRLRAQLGTERLDFIISFTEPWFLDQRLTLGVDAYYSEASFLSDLYDEGRIGGDIKLGRPLTPFMKGEIMWKHELVEIFNVSKPRPKPGGNYDDLKKSYSQAAPQEVQDAKGTTAIDTFNLTLDRDTRDNVFLTKKGNRAVFNTEIANPIGDAEYWKVDFKVTHYFPFFNNNHVLLLLFATGTGQEYGDSDDIPFFEKYYLGGGNNLRGFAFREVGPKVPHNPKPLVPPTKPQLGVGEPIGGNTYAWSTVEYTIPIISRVRFAMFFDIGQVWDNTFEYNLGDLNSDAGLGLRLDLPIGPIRLDYAFPIQTDQFNDNGGRFNFNVGYQF